MPTKKKSSKRTNWREKYEASCASRAKAIGIVMEIAVIVGKVGHIPTNVRLLKAQAGRIPALEQAVIEANDAREAAERHNAELLRVECLRNGRREPEPEYCLCGEEAPECRCKQKFAPTLWQRFKGAIGGWARRDL